MLKKNEIVTLEIIDISNDGNGVAKHDSIAVFVPMSAVGDICQVKILKVLTSYCFGKIEKIIKPSPDRIEAKCKIFSQCGGCDFLHINYNAEKMAKQNFVKSCFKRLGGITAPVMETMSCDKEYRYRNKVQLPVSEDEHGNATAGFYAQRSHRVIPCRDCLLLTEFLNEVSQTIVDLLNKHKIKPYNEENQQGFIRHIYLRHGEQTDSLMVCLVSTTSKIKNIDLLVKELLEKFTFIKTVVLNVNNKNTNVILGEKNIVLYGDSTITDILCDVKVKLSPHSFYQVNHDGAQKLYTIAKEMLQLNKKDILLDLYCGAGTIGLSMAKDVDSLIGVEIVPQAIENAKENALLNNISNAKFICSDAKDAVAKLLKENYRPTAIVLDPARKGCDIPTLEAVVKMAPKRIAMISCNPATAARDCKYLMENGYQPQYIQPFDMFPRTKHVETVVLMSRVKE